MDALAAVVQLSHKYQIDHLLAQGLSLLMEQYTDDFEEWIKPDRTLPIAALDIHAIVAINIAHVTKTPSIMPLAFLAVSRTGADVLRGCLRDGQWAEGLCLPDVDRVINGRAAWAEASSKALARIFAPDVSMGCVDSRRCLKLLAAKASRLDLLMDRMWASASVLTWADEFGDSADVFTGSKLCDSCRDMIDARELEERKMLWNTLPAMFDLTLEGWSV